MARQQDQGKRCRIIDAAFTTFGDLGFSRATIKDIALRAGISPGTIYTYFSDKEALFRTAVAEAWTRFHASMAEIRRSAGSYDQKLERLIDVGFDSLRQVHPILHGMIGDAVRMDLFDQNLEAFCDNLEALISESRQQEEVPEVTDHETRRFYVRTIASGILFQLSLVEPERLSEEIERMKRLLKRNTKISLDLGRAGGWSYVNYAPTS